MKTFIHHDIGKLERKTYPDGTRLYKTPSGNAYPSITTITGLHNKQQIIEWRKRVGAEEATRISTRAASRGTRLHSLCEAFLRSERCEPDFFDQELFGSIKPFLQEIDNIHALETPLYSDFLEAAGTVDCIAEFRGKLCVIDFKTSSRVKDREDIHNYFMQTAAYAVAFEERTKIPVGRLVIIMAVENEPQPLLFMEKRDDWIDAFRSLRKDYKRLFNI